MNQEHNNYSLFDFMKHIFEYRKLIILGTVILTAILIPVHFLFKTDNNFVQVDYKLSFNELPSKIYNEIYSSNESFKVKNLIVNYAKTPSMLAPILKKHDVFDFKKSNLSSEEFNFKIVDLTNSLITIKPDEGCETVSVSFKVRKSHIEECDSIIGDLSSAMDSIIDKMYYPELVTLNENTIKTVGKISSDLITKSDMSYYQQLQYLTVQLESFLKTKHNYVEYSPKFVYANKMSTKIFCLVYLFVSLIIMVLVSFFYDYLKNNLKKSNN